MKRNFVGLLLVVLLLALAAPRDIADAQSPTPETKDWPGYGASAHRGENGKQFVYYCPPFDPSKGYIQGANIYGTDLYTDDTEICAAAAHAGAVIPAAGGTVTIEIRPGTTSYQGSTRNGVISADWPRPADGSFVFVTNQPVPTQLPSACDWTGSWKRNDESFSWVQNGTQVTGTGLTDTTWSLTGTVSGNVLTGKWADHTGSGSIKITLSADCNSFDSSWGVGDNTSSFTGHGTRASSAGATNVQCDHELETLTVSSKSSDTLHSNAVLASGQTYAIISSGVVGLFPNTTTGFDTLYDHRTAGQEARPQFGAFLYVNDKPLTDWMMASGQNVGYRADHTYGSYLPGNNQALAVKFYETGDYGDNEGNLTVKLCGAPANASSGMTLEAPNRLALPNDLLLIPIKLNNAVNLANLNFELEYDPAVLREEGDLIKGNLLDNALFSGNPATAGLIKNGFAQTSGLSGTGTVVNVPFRIIGKPGDKSPLALRVTTVNDPSGAVPTVITISGEVSVTNPDGTLPGGGGANGGSCQQQLETLTVSSQSPATLTSKTVLAPGQPYTLIVSGVAGLFPNTNTGFDALYDYRKPGQEGRVTVDAPANDSLLVINGHWLSDLITASGGSIAYNSDHNYPVTVTGSGQPITAKFSDWGSYDDNAGVLTITLCAGGGGNGGNAGSGPSGIARGDCDGDSHINELDALCALEMSVQLRPVQLLMDMDNTGDVTSRDAVIILQRAVGGK